VSDGRWLFIDRSDLINGEEHPKYDTRLEADRKVAAALWPRIKSLTWAAQNQPSAFAPALFSFSKRRRHMTRSLSGLLPTEGWSLLTLIPVVDQLREPLGADWDPWAAPSSWPRVLFNGVDDAVNVMWLLRVGLTIPAALLARALLERWTYNVAHHYKISRLLGESDSDYMSRVWQVYTPYGVPSHVGSWWGTLSEIVHGHQTAGRLGSFIVSTVSESPEANVEIHRGICLTVGLCLRQIRGGLSNVVVDAGERRYVPPLQADAPVFEVPSEPLDLEEAFEDLDYYEAHRVLSERWTQLAALYRENVKDPDRRLTEQFDPVLTVECMLERRGRAIERSRAAFATERESMGDDFDPGFLAARLFRYACFSELALLLGSDCDGPEAAALLTAAQCLDAAVHLWLEDSDHSMGCLRVVLEQTARLRVHRLKKRRAVLMETRGDASSSRWLEEAGWRRLSVLLRAINEFAHLGANSRRHGAREALLQVQIDDPQAETSRGSALDSVAHLLAFELHDRLAAESKTAAACFTGSVTLIDQQAHLSRLERYLNNAQALRDFDFGEPDFWQ
jgi:hypothetical protein